MSSLLKDLWPDNVGSVGDLVTPVAILRQQAEFLGRRTNNLVEAEVKSLEAGGSEFVHNLYLVAPALGSYRFTLMQIRHGVNLYPVDVIYAPTTEAYSAKTEDEFLERLRAVFADERTVKVINSLVAQSRV